MSVLSFLLPLATLLFVAAASSSGVGDYVAQGVGMGSDAQSIPATQPVSEGVLTVSGRVLTATKLENGDILVANQTVHPDSTTAAATRSIDSGSATNGSVDECYSSWDEYWSASHASYMASWSGKNIKTVPQTTWTVTGTNSYPGYKAGTSTQVTTIDTTVYLINGGFTISTETLDTTSTTLITRSDYSGDTTTYTNTGTLYSTSTIKGAYSVPPKPTCKLPSVVGDCQNKWEAYITSRLVPSPTPPPHCDINAGFLQNTNSVPPCASSYAAVESSYYSKYEGSEGLHPPLCTAASIGGSLCQSVRDKYQQDDSFAPTIDEKIESAHGGPFFFNQGTQGLYNGGNSTYWIWPTSSTMMDAPSCTLGCGRCAVTGGTVQLIYWPATSTQSNNASVQARATPPPVVTVETLGTTFTSPTLYISYESLYAENACGTIGSEIGETILAIPPDKPLSSVYAGTIPCDAHFRPTQIWTGTAPFTVEDLHEPVPYSIYSSQPWCQTYLREHGCTGTCPTTAPYKPILVVNNDLLRGLQADWSDCWGDIRGVYDPPLALTEVQSEAGASITYHAVPSPTPATGPAPNTAAPTATAEPDNVPASSDGEAQPSLPKQPESPTDSDPRPVPTQDPRPDTPAPSNPQPTIVKVDPQEISLSPVEDHSSALQVVHGDHTTMLTQGGPAVTVGSQVVSAAKSGGIVVGTGHDASTIDPIQVATAATINNQGFSIAPVADHSTAVEVVNGGNTATLTPGGPAVTVGSQVMSAAKSGGGVVVGTGRDASTIDAVQTPTAATLHAQAFTMSELKGESRVVQVIHNGKTRTLTPGGSAVTMDSQMISAASSGMVVIGTGSTASTVDVQSALNKSSSHSSSGSSSTTRSSTTTSGRPSSTTAAASSSSSAAAGMALESSGAFMIALLFGVLAL